MPEYVAKEAVKQAMRSQPRGILFTEWELDQVPTVDVVEVVHGRWEAKDSGFDWELQCSLCGEQYWIEKGELETHKPNYCPNCGAKMDGGINK